MLIRFEADADVQISCCLIGGVEAKLDTFSARCGQEVYSGGEQVASEASPLMRNFGSHRLDKARRGGWAKPEQAIRSDVLVAIKHEQIKVWTIQGRLSKSYFELRSVSLDHVVRTLQGVEASAQAVVLMKRTDGQASARGQARYDDTEASVLRHGETVATQNVLGEVIGPIDNHVDVSNPVRAGVSKSALKDMHKPLRRRVRHHDRIESDSVAPIGGDHCRLWTPLAIEPEELREVVG